MRWIKASRCAADSPQCVEVARSDDGTMVHIRNSTRPKGLTLDVRVEDFARMVEQIKAGEDFPQGILSLSEATPCRYGAFTIHFGDTAPSTGVYYTAEELRAFRAGLRAGEFDSVYAGALVAA